MRTNKNYLIKKLIALEKMRKKLVSSFLNEDPDIFESIWRYYRHPQIMELALHKFLLSWLNDHWYCFHTVVNEMKEEDSLESSVVEKELLKIYYNFLSRLCNLKSIDNDDVKSSISNLFNECVKDNLQCIDNLLNLHGKHEIALRRLKTARYRHKEIFQQKIDAFHKTK